MQLREFVPGQIRIFTLITTSERTFFEPSLPLSRAQFRHRLCCGNKPFYLFVPHFLPGEHFRKPVLFRSFVCLQPSIWAVAETFEGAYPARRWRWYFSYRSRFLLAFMLLRTIMCVQIGVFAVRVAAGWTFSPSFRSHLLYDCYDWICGRMNFNLNSRFRHALWVGP